MTTQVRSPEEAAALDAVSRYDVSEPSLSLVKRMENATFRVSDGRLEDAPNFALRLHRHGYQTRPSLNQEIAVLQHLGRVPELRVPRPVPNADGEYVTSVPGNRRIGETMAVMFRWERGDSASRFGQFSPSWLSETGRIVGVLHRELASLSPGDVAHRPIWDANGVAGGRLFASERAKRRSKWGRATESNWYEHIEGSLPGVGLTREQMRIIVDAGNGMSRIFESLDAIPSGWGAIHGDLNLSNFLVSGSRTCVVDFDDMGWGCYTYDLATAVVWMRLRHLPAESEAAFLRGYLPLSGQLVNPELLEHAVAARCFGLIRWCVGNYERSPEVRRWVDRAVPTLISALVANRLDLK